MIKNENKPSTLLKKKKRYSGQTEKRKKRNERSKPQKDFTPQKSGWGLSYNLGNYNSAIKKGEPSRREGKREKTT